MAAVSARKREPTQAILHRVAAAVRAAIRREGMLVPGDRVGLAVSGGADSVALLRIFERLRAELGITLAVLHFDHMLRRGASDADRDFVAKLAGRLGLELFCAREDVTKAAARNRWNLEDAGRRLRYAFFERLVAQGQVSRVAVAHTADDQAETVLAHLLRGTGPAGLAGIYPVSGSVIRPLLWTRRDDLRAYLRSIRQRWREDATNRDPRRLRARIRAELLPLLERAFNPGTAGHLAQLADFAREEEQFWRAVVENRFRALARPAVDNANGSVRTFEIAVSDLMGPLYGEGSDAARAAPARASSHSKALVRGPGQGAIPQFPLAERLIRRICAEIEGSATAGTLPKAPGLTGKHVKQVVHLATDSSSGHRLELPRGICVERSFDVLTFSRTLRASAGARRLAPGPGAARASSYHLRLTVPRSGEATIAVPEAGLCLRLQIVDRPSDPRRASFASRTSADASETVLTRQAAGVIALDVARLPDLLILRNWRPGDAYRPQGHRNRRKLKEMFVSRRVPAPQRRAWPVIESGGEIVWARAMPPARDFLAGETTRKALLISEVAWEIGD